MNLIPKKPCEAPNYWCTWALQNYIYGQGQETIDLNEIEGNIGAKHGRTHLNEDLLLRKGGWAKKLYPSIREDLFILLDDGWDVPINTPVDSKSFFSSFYLDEEKFPSFVTSPLGMPSTRSNSPKTLSAPLT